MLRLLEISADINIACGQKTLSEEDIFAMKVAVASLTPICIATDIVQSDACQLIDANVIIDKCKAMLEEAANLPITSTEVKDKVVGAVAAVKASLAGRTQKHLESDVLRYLNALDPRLHQSNELLREVSEACKAYFATLNVAVNVADLAENIAEFKVRTEAEKKEHPTKFWKTKQTSCTYLSRFHHFLSSLVVSEAAVERSFNSQTHILTGERNRLTNQTMNMFLFCKVNFAKLKQKHRPLQVKRSNTLSHEEWKLLLLSLTEVPSKRKTRQEHRKENALGLHIGDTVSVEFVTAGKAIMHDGVIVELGKKEGEFVVYWKSSKKTSEFLPLTVDTTWRKVEDQ